MDDSFVFVPSNYDSRLTNVSIPINGDGRNMVTIIKEWSNSDV